MGHHPTSYQLDSLVATSSATCGPMASSNMGGGSQQQLFLQQQRASTRHIRHTRGQHPEELRTRLFLEAKVRSRVGGAAAQDWPGPERNQSVPVLSGIHRLVLWREALLCAGWGRGHSQCAKAQSRGICAGGAVWRLRPEEGEGGRIEGKEERPPREKLGKQLQKTGVRLGGIFPHRGQLAPPASLSCSH